MNKPIEFINQYLVDPFNAYIKEKNITKTDSDEETQLNFLGDDGGSWTLQLKGGEVKLVEDFADEPLLQFTMSVDDWRKIFIEELPKSLEAAGIPEDKRAKGISRLVRVVIDDQKVNTLKNMEGDIQIVLTGLDTDRRFTITLGGDAYEIDEPKTKVTMEYSLWVEIMTGKANAQEAFFQGKIRLEGDMNLAMGAMPVMM